MKLRSGTRYQLKTTLVEKSSFSKQDFPEYQEGIPCLGDYNLDSIDKLEDSYEPPIHMVDND